MTGIRSRGIIAAAATGAAFGIGAIVLQRWVAQTFGVALLLVVIWFALVAVVAVVHARRRPGALGPVLATLVLIASGSAAVAYWTTFRKDEVNETVAMAATRVGGPERTAALAGGAPKPGSHETRTARPRELLSGEVEGQDGHAGEGIATVVEEGGDRVLTLTDFDVDAGPDVNVYLSTSAAGIDDAIELGDLKGERGDQEYEIPAGADLTRYDELVLYCIPFTTRIATAELR